MRKAVTINIAGRSFFIDEDAFAQLEQYLKKLEAWLKNKEGGQEIFSDIESRIRELFEEKIDAATGVITMHLVNEIISTMGQPEDIGREEDEASEKKEPESHAYTTPPPRRKLYRDMDDKILGGVCSGIAAYFNIDKLLVRVIFAILPFLSFGAIIPVYIILWIAVPPALSFTQRLEMSGRDLNISNIEKNIRDEYQDVKQRFQKSSMYRNSEAYLSRFRQRDRSALIVTAAIMAFILIFSAFNNSFGAGFIPAHSFHMPFGSFSFLSVTHLVIILLILGLIFRTAFKGFLLLILILLAISFIFNTLQLFAWTNIFHIAI
jgi:phage shock protein PspC (stress-responsive transcriptional regulator)